MSDRDDLAALILPLLPYSDIPEMSDALKIADAVLSGEWFNAETIEPEEAEYIFRESLKRVKK